jgi:hypothetical protein
MKGVARLSWILAVAAAGATAVVALTWLLERVMPPPYSGYLALVLVGLAVTELIRRRPRQQAERMFRLYCRDRERGLDETTARERLLRRRDRSAAGRQRLPPQTGAAWTGKTEKDRVTAGVALLLACEGKTCDSATLAAAWDHVRDRFTIPGWETLPREFVDRLRSRLDAEALVQLDALMEQHRVFHQRFFRQPSALAADPAASVADFARLLGSLANHIAEKELGAAERAYRISLRLRPEENLAHAGLAFLLEKTGRSREAAREASIALGVLDDYARRAAERPATTEDIYPFKTPLGLREALTRVAKSA